MYELLAAGGYIYVCGDARNMAKEVAAAIESIAVQHGGKTQQQARDWVKELRKKKRYSEDVWA
jgi:sulfite reductase alpha subunit-like flavoprotein